MRCLTQCLWNASAAYWPSKRKATPSLRVSPRGQSACARAASGHAVAAPTRSVTNLRRGRLEDDPVRLPLMPSPEATLRPLPWHRAVSPPITRTTFPTCRAHYPGGSSGCTCRLLPRSRGLPQMAKGSASALSLSRLLRLHSRSRRIAQPPKPTFVTRLQPARLPARTARQLPDQSTTLRVDSSSTDESRLRGALPSSRCR
jgi:hypothetical protein